ncbi:hypothetical protein [Xanthomonas bonasiae]|uniref:hypothetical protein n=1 Tax=Xanthomonas bonasiae TaxID=2810351 RepID=UPI0019814C52|nr:hypothetical protein [Xanthomonas bonasiae]MBN6112748.1 hypothetical protein [Xanthomonas bonasiae]
MGAAPKRIGIADSDRRIATGTKEKGAVQVWNEGLQRPMKSFPPALPGEDGFACDCV